MGSTKLELLLSKPSDSEVPRQLAPLLIDFMIPSIEVSEEDH